MERYKILIYLVLILALIYAVGIFLFKSGVFNGIGNPLNGKSFDFLRPSSYRYNFQSSQNSGSPVSDVSSGQQKNFLPPAGFSLSDLSPYFGQVQIISLERGYISGEKKVKTIIFRTDYSLKSDINVTGWRVRGNKGGEISIPRAVNFLKPVFWTPSDLFLEAGNYLNIYSSPSPMGVNFRLNRCTGYLNNFYDFNPDLPNNCPSVSRSEIINFSGACQNLIRSIGSCKLPREVDLQTPYVLNEPACRAFLDRINYRGCFENLSGKPDFLLREWRAWLDKNVPFDVEHDRLLLFDNQGLLVDEHVY